MSDIVQFLEGRGTDGAGRSLQQVFAFGLGDLERRHDYIQWLFPLAEPSAAVPGSPILNDQDIAALKVSPAAQTHLAQSAEYMIGFYEATDHWLMGVNHNHRRITRIIKSLRLLCGDIAADDFRDRILDRVDRMSAPVSATSRNYWADA